MKKWIIEGEKTMKTEKEMTWKEWKIKETENGWLRKWKKELKSTKNKENLFKNIDFLLNNAKTWSKREV